MHGRIINEVHKYTGFIMSGWQLGPGAQNGKSNGLSILIDTEQEQTKGQFKIFLLSKCLTEVNRI